MRTHPDIGLMTTRQQACSRLAATCAFLAMWGLHSQPSLLRYDIPRNKRDIKNLLEILIYVLKVLSNGQSFLTVAFHIVLNVKIPFELLKMADFSLREKGQHA